MATLILFSILFVLSFPINAYAYLDPSSGSVLFLTLLSIVTTVYYLFKQAFYKLKLLFHWRSPIKKDTHTFSIIFYSEGASYWNTFKPILDALELMNQKALYLTSDNADPGLLIPYQNIKTQYIGEGNKAYAYLNNLKANICIMTTPNLDIFQIKRSKHIQHYCHVVHGPTDILSYKIYSLDYYDSVLCSGEHQIKSIRSLEKLRNIKTKELFLTGCPYTDVLIKKLKLNSDSRINDQNNNQKTIQVLIAPTWGNNGLLKRTELNFLKTLCANPNYKITIRPHPQSLLVETKLIKTIQKKYSEFTQITWDTTKDNFFSLNEADILLSDVSGIMLDCSLIFSKPVIYLDYTPNWLGTEAHEVKTEPWEMSVLETLGKKISIDELHNLNQHITQCIADKASLKEQIKTIRSQCLVNYGQAGKACAQQILALYQQEILKAKNPLNKSLNINPIKETVD